MEENEEVKIEVSENMKFYDAFRSVPDNAKKEIVGGKLKGFTDINPMWRIKKLTEVFGACGLGWKTKIVEEKEIQGAGGEIAIIMKIHLFFETEGCWSDPIEGIGGSMLVKKENGGLVTNDEAYKMAFTDALSVAFKMLGGGADVYYQKDQTKYDLQGNQNNNQNTNQQTQQDKPKSKYTQIHEMAKQKGLTDSDVKDWIAKKWKKSIAFNSLSDEQFKELMEAMEKFAFTMDTDMNLYFKAWEKPKYKEKDK